MNEVYTDLEFSNEVEKRANQMLIEMIKENSPKMLQWFMLALGREMKAANATDLDMSCHLDLNDGRYKVSVNTSLEKLETK
jgi:hypothetical protein